MNYDLISTLLEAGTPVKSLEFFPPRTEEDKRRLILAASRLKAFAPDFVSVTYGAGGSTRQFTQETTELLQNELGWLVMPHLTCVGASREELKEVVQGFHDSGFRNIMTLRGDPPKGAGEFMAARDGFRYASDLVTFIRKNFPDICLGVAGYPGIHPESPSVEQDIEKLKFKVDQGGSFITTQLFYDNNSYFSFVARLRASGVTVPVLPGILPLQNVDQAQRFGVSLPEALIDRLEEAGEDKTAQRQVGVDWAIDQIAELLDRGAPGVHLYIMNRSKSALGILDGLLARGYFKE